MRSLLRARQALIFITVRSHNHCKENHSLKIAKGAEAPRNRQKGIASKDGTTSACTGLATPAASAARWAVLI
jgi:hypothetical protein